MPPDEVYLLDMLNAARRVVKFSAGLTWDAFQQSELHQSALVKQLEIIGEAARHVSPGCQAAHAAIPWKEIVGMRNRLIHDYTRIDLPTVWDTVRNHIAPLIVQLEPLVPPDDGSNPSPPAQPSKPGP